MGWLGSLTLYPLARPAAADTVPLVQGGVLKQATVAGLNSAPVITDATTARDLAATDEGCYLRFTNASAKTLTVRDEADVALPAFAEFHGRNVGAGDLTIVEDTAVTINVPAGGSLVVPQGGTFTLKRVAADEFDLFGVTTP